MTSEYRIEMSDQESTVLRAKFSRERKTFTVESQNFPVFLHGFVLRELSFARASLLHMPLFCTRLSFATKTGSHARAISGDGSWVFSWRSHFYALHESKTSPNIT